MKRQKLYYPEYQITKDLFTRGGELMDVSGNEYIGYYHVYTTGEIFSEAAYVTGKSIKLYPLTRDMESPYKRIKINKMSYMGFLRSDFNFKKYTQPKYRVSKPTADDFTRKYYYRFFAVKRNDKNTIFEISRDAFNSYGKVGGINNILYIVESIKWVIAGPEVDTKTLSGQVLEYGVDSSNTRTLNQLSRRYPTIKTIFPNTTQYSIYDESFTDRPI
jgi:hypothetical protein